MRNTTKTTLILTLACLTLNAAGQENQPISREEAIKRLELQRDRPSPSPPTFDISFPGGNAKQLVAAIEKSTGHSINVIIPVELAETPFPKIEFKSVDLPSLFRALELAQGSRGVHWANVSNVMVLMAREREQALETGVFYVGDLLTKFGIDDVTTAVQTAWAMAQDDSKPELKYHQDTQLLIVRVPKAKLMVVKDVLSELHRAVMAAGPSKN